MNKPKRHHYVPQFYLRRFSTDRRSIICYNKAKRLLIPRASIKGQCAIDNYYSWNDQVEPSLGILEGYIASLLKEIDNSNTLPPVHSDEWQILLVFIAIQSARTKMSGDSNNAMTDYFAKTMARGAPELKNINIDEFEVRETYPTAMPIQISVQSYEYLASLGRCLLVNSEKLPFICSDNPIILYNSQRSHWQDRGVIGLDSAGIQIIFPISPRLAIYLYDSDVYANPSNTPSRKIRKDDAAKINLLNFLWSDENVYLSSIDQSHMVHLIAEISDNYMNYERVSIRESAPVSRQDGETSSLILHFRPHAPIELSFGFANYSAAVDKGQVDVRTETNRSQKRGPVTARYEFSVENERRHLAGNELTRGLRRILKLAV